MQLTEHKQGENCNINHENEFRIHTGLNEKDSKIVCYLKIGFLPKQTRFILS